MEVGFSIEGNDTVDPGFPEYDEGECLVYINPDQYFDGISPKMWEYKVGAYQPLEKFLSDRRGEELSGETRRHYETLATSISRVLDVLPVLDATWEGILNGELHNPLPEITATLDA